MVKKGWVGVGWVLPITLVLACFAPATVAQDAATIERREAAVGFIYTQAMALGVLRRWERNRDSLDASAWVVSQAVARYRAEGAAQQAQARERAMLQAFAGAMLPMLRAHFARQLPTAEACAKALAPYRRPEIDLHNAGQLASPMQGTLQEFARTLDEVRRDPAYRAPDEKFRTFDAQVSVMSVALLTHDAIDAAQARSDGATVIRGYERLAASGDPTAAQSLGLAHLDGRWVAKAPAKAAGWFYNAWALGEPEGLNALGVVWRDGLVGAPEPALALVAFAAASQSPRASAQAHQRAVTNLERLFTKATPPIVEDAACLRLSTLHEKARALATMSGIPLQPPPPATPDFRVLERHLTGASQPACFS
jgi:hypothetical protein